LSTHRESAQSNFKTGIAPEDVTGHVAGRCLGNRIKPTYLCSTPKVYAGFACRLGERNCFPFISRAHMQDATGPFNYEGDSPAARRSRSDRRLRRAALFA